MRRLVVLTAVAFAAAFPAAAHAARTDDFNKPVVMIPGPEQSDPSCKPFDDMAMHFAEYTTSVLGKKISFGGTTVQLGLYPGSSGCDDTLGAQRGESLDQLADRLAKWIEDKGKTVDVVAHGGAGLIVRDALERQPKLHVEDVVTLGTPHNGSEALAADCGSRPVCAELGKRSSLARNPQGAGGTDWSVIASEADTLVSVDSAVAMDAAHKTIYEVPTHDGLLTDTNDTQNAKIRYSHAGGGWTEWEAAPHVVDRVADDLIFGVGAASSACGLQATKPEVCGKTPVIFIPGFGASQLECTTVAGTSALWPAALTDGKKYPSLALGTDGSKPLNGTEPCAKTVKANGHVVESIHADSWAWLQRIAPGRAYEYGWDFRKGPDQALAGLDKLIDKVRAQHGASRVALVAHAEGGLVARWYIDDPAKAKKIARVADFGSPFWGAPQVWLTAAYDHLPPGFAALDENIDKNTLRTFTKNLTGLYYLLPPQAWFDGAPTVLQNWLEVDDKPVKSLQGVSDQLRAFGANASIATKVARNQQLHTVGFTRENGVDWRVFAGSGMPTLGHIRAYSGTDTVQYSWINGDGTVPLFSQRQSATVGTPQLGDKTPTYNFCGVAHSDELEDHAIQAAAAPFVADGADPIVDGTTLKQLPCQLSASEFKVTGNEDARSISLSQAATAGAASVRAHAAQAGPLTLAEAQARGLVQVVDDGVFVTNRPVVVHAEGTVQVTPITGDGRRGESRVYVGPADISVSGAQVEATVASRPADRTPPRTTAKRRGRKLVLTARDVSGVAVTLVKLGKARPRPYTRPIAVPRHATVRYWSVDTLGNREPARSISGDARRRSRPAGATPRRGS